MYYKITNKESKIFKELHDLRAYELRMEKENIELIQRLTGQKFSTYFGHTGQQTFRRVTEYIGLKFNEPEKVCLSTWKLDPKTECFFINGRTKKGQAMRKELNNNLQGSYFTAVEDILNLPHLRKFSFTYLEIAKDILILFLDDQQRPKQKDLIEITRTEFEALRKSASKKI